MNQSKELKINIFTTMNQVFSSKLSKIQVKSPYSDIFTYLQLKIPKSLILYKFIITIIELLFPFVLQEIYQHMDLSSYLIKLIIIIALLGFFRIFLHSQWIWKMGELQMGLKLTISHSIYNKQLDQISQKDNQTWNIICNESGHITNYYNSLMTTWSQIFKMCVAVVYLYIKMKLAVIIGLVIAIVLVYVNFQVAKKIGQLYGQGVVIKGEKIRLMSFIVQKIRELKMCRLENYIFQKLRSIRQRQLKNLTLNKLLDSICVFFWQLTSILISGISFIIYIKYFKQDTSIKFNVMTAISMFQMLIMPLNALPWSIAGMKNAKFSRDRVMALINKQKCTVKSKVINIENFQSDDVKIQIDEGEIQGKEDFKLKINKMTLQKGNLYYIKGKSTSGKSLFLKSLLKLVSSNYPCQIKGKIGYVQPHLFHLKNYLKSIRNQLDNQQQIDQQIKDLLLLFHCLQIPLSNPTDSYSGGQKLRLSLVRAFYKRDIVIIDTTLESTDKIVRDYLQRGIKKLVSEQNKLVILVDERIQNVINKNIIVENNEVRLEENDLKLIQQQQGIQNYEKYKQQYYEKYMEKDYGAQIKEKIQERIFQTDPEKQKIVGFENYKFYYKSKLHILFILSMISLYWLKNYYNFYTNSSINEPNFITNLFIIIVLYMVVVLIRALSFTFANIFQTRRIIKQFIKTIAFGNIDFHEVHGNQQMIERYTGDSETIDNGYPFISNIFCNNVFEFGTMLLIILMEAPFLFVPISLSLIYFYTTQKYYRRINNNIKVLDKQVSWKTLEVVESTIKGKILIKGMGDQLNYRNPFYKRRSQCINIEASKILLDRWLTQSFRLLTHYLLIGLLLITYFYGIEHNSSFKIMMAITYILNITDQLGYLVNSLAQTQKDAFSIKRIHQFILNQNQLDQNRMTQQLKTKIKNNQQSNLGLHIEKLYFNYPKSQQFILNGLDIILKKGEKILIRGKTGSGKTTLFKILTGLYSPQCKLHASAFVSFSPQKPLILPGSFSQNLDPYGIIPQQEINMLIKRFSSEDIKNITYNQQLRINIIRAQLYGKNGIVIYDEPLEDLNESGTCIIVSHHGKYKVDRIYELIDGVLQEINQ